MKLSNHLDKILQFKKREIERLLEETRADPKHPLNLILSDNRPPSTHFSDALRTDHLSVIAEIKRRSPTAGSLRPIQDPVELALRYCQGGASAISILTDSESFGGSLNDLKQVAHSLNKDRCLVPLLRKDFILHPLQLAEAVASGAQAVLLIVSAVGKELKRLIKEAEHLGLETLTEVHDRADLDLALEAEAPVIGINHRNLQTFEIDLKLSEKLFPLIPSSVITVAESGIRSIEEAKRMRELGFDAILVGEALVRSEDPVRLIELMRGELHDS